MRADKFCFQARIPVLQQHGDDLAQVGVEFVQRFRLRMRPRKDWHLTDEQTGDRTPLYDRSEGLHKTIIQVKPFVVNPR